MLLGYNTNGFAHHALPDVLAILAELGCQSVAITLDQNVLNPYGRELDLQIKEVRALLGRYSLRCIIETGARYLLDPQHKHQPTLVSTSARDRQRRLGFLRSAVDIAHALESTVVSFWSGSTLDDAARELCMNWLVEGCQKLCDYALSRRVRLALEPEPGMLVERMADFEEARDRISRDNLGLTLDIGHLHCVGDMPAERAIERWRHLLWNTHMEDMRRNQHEHLMFGEGEIDFPPIFAALRAAGYSGGVHVELSHHSHDAVATAKKAMQFLERCIEEAQKQEQSPKADAR
jgi:sugar phosphate isomerase/epimerase